MTIADPSQQPDQPSQPPGTAEPGAHAGAPRSHEFYPAPDASKPSIGRIVMFVDHDEYEDRPAIVTRVVDIATGTVNLTVFRDISDSPGNAQVRNVIYSPVPGNRTWHWPIRS